MATSVQGRVQHVALCLQGCAPGNLTSETVPGKEAGLGHDLALWLPTCYNMCIMLWATWGLSNKIPSLCKLVWFLLFATKVLLCKKNNTQFLNFFFFLMWTILKDFIEFVTTLLPFYILGSWPQGMWDPSSLTRVWTCTLCIRRQSPNNWTASAQSVAQSCLSLCDPWTAGFLCPWGFLKQEYWSRLPFPSPGLFLTQGWRACLSFPA